MILFFILPLIVCFSGDSEPVNVDFEKVNTQKMYTTPKNTDDVAQNLNHTKLCGEVPGVCDESMTDIDIIINKTVDDIHISVHNIIVILLVCIIIQ